MAPWKMIGLVKGIERSPEWLEFKDFEISDKD